MAPKAAKKVSKKRRSRAGEVPPKVPAGRRPIQIAGLELGGGKSSRTAMVVLELFRTEGRFFLREVLPHIQPDRDQPGDQVLLAELERIGPKRIGVNAPLNLPPWFDRKRGRSKVKDPLASAYAPIRWMRDEAERAGISAEKLPTPYTQRPVDVLLRTRIQPKVDIDLFIEETLGGGRAPVAARMQFLQQALSGVDLLETNPRVALAGLAEWFGIGARELRRYRNLEDGAEYRMTILDQLDADLRSWGVPQLFLYESDKQLLAQELGAFNALLSGIMAVYSYARILQSPDRDFDRDWGFVAIPKPKSEISKRSR